MTDLDKMGQVVSWVSPPVVSVADLRLAMTGAGFDPAIVKELAPRNAFSRAARQLSTERVIRHVPRDDDDEHVYFQFTKEHLEAHGYDYTTECILRVHKDTGDVWAQSGGVVGFDLAREAERLLKEHQVTKLKGDVTALVQRIFKAQEGLLVRIREEGGVYFVPDRYHELVDKIRLMLTAIGGRLKSYVIMMGELETDKSIADDMAVHFADMIATLHSSINELSEDVSYEVLARRLDKVTKQRTLLEANAVLLGARLDEINDALVNAEKEMFKRLTSSGDALAVS